MSHQNVYLALIFLYYWFSLCFGKAELPIKVFRSLIDSQYVDAIDCDHLKLKEMANFTKLFFLFFSFNYGIGVFETIWIEDEVVVACDHDSVLVRDILDELPKLGEFLSPAVHGEISSVDEDISCGKLVHLYLVVHAMRI